MRRTRILLGFGSYFDHDATALVDAFIWLGPDDVEGLPVTELD